MHARSVVFVLLVSPAAAQQFVRNTADVPASSGYTEQVDFVDVDLDGDWDAGFANGGDIGNQQSVLWINAGGAQAGILGVFANETTTRFPALTCSSRDIEFADYDGDADPDAFLANHTAITNQPSRFWTNRGGAQGGTIGTFVDETSGRWVGLGAAGSSIPPAQVLGSGGFVEWAAECDFADVDSDGDLDFVQATVGTAFSGNAPSRVFLNDGTGFFTEFNPSGFQLTGTTIPNGSPGLWCEGGQSPNTTDSTGTLCDVAAAATDADFADVDGDLDIDMLLGDRQAPPRLFRNRLEENGGAFLSFRDVTGISFQAGYATGNGHYEQCFGDFDQDDDLDLYGVNWLVSGAQFHDSALQNTGAGFYGNAFTIPASAPDDHTAEPIDHDNDGDLDVWVSSYGQTDRIARYDGGWTFSNATGVVAMENTITLDTDVADVDADGDYDAFSANDANQADWFLENTAIPDDVTAPRIARLEQAPDRVPGLEPTVVRWHVYDNTPPQQSQWLRPVIELRVDGSPSGTLPTTSSFAQVFRGEIPGLIAGVVEYRVRIADEHGNTSESPWLTYTATFTGAPFCSGDGTGTACPCGNNASAGRGCGNSLGAGAQLIGSGDASVASDTFALIVSAVPNSSVLFFQGTTEVAGGAGSVFGDGLRCAGGSVARLGTKTATANSAQYPQAGDVAISVKGAVPPTGGVRTYQAWYRNAASYCTPSTFNLSNGWTVQWLP